MTKCIRFITLVTLALAFSHTLLAQISIAYMESSEVIANPERGLFLYGGDSIDHSSQCWGGDARFKQFASDLEEARKDQITLVYLQYDLGAFRLKGKIDETFFSCVRQDFKEVKKHGFKVILRFAYNPRKNEDFGGANNVANPYEATIERIIKHLKDPKFVELIHTNSHLIAVWQAGFLGKYGEWYYTAKDAGIQEAPNMTRRVEVLKTMLEVLDKPGIVQVRTPYYKSYAIKALAGQPAVATDFDDRIGFYHDSFFQNDEAESGTFSSYNDAPEMVSDWRAYFLTQGLRLPIGGETSDQPKVTMADTEVKRLQILNEFATYHWSFFNRSKVLKEIRDSDDHDKLIMDWTHLLTDSSRRLENYLGYRLVLKESKFHDRVKSGDKLKVDLILANIGWAAPFKPRKVEIFLCPKSSNPCPDNKNGFALLENVDVRSWLPTRSIELSALISTSGLPKGAYYLILNLPDLSEQLKAASPYSIRLANTKDGKDKTGKLMPNVFSWDPIRGYNQFGTVMLY